MTMNEKMNNKMILFACLSCAAAITFGINAGCGSSGSDDQEESDSDSTQRDRTTDDDTGDDTGDDTDRDDTDRDDTDRDDDDPPPTPSCDGDWTLGSTFYTCPDCGLGQACDPGSHPKNCADGTFIMFADGSCHCIAACSSFSNVQLGDPCDKAGKWHCRSIRATNTSANGGKMCVPDAWDICEEGDVNRDDGDDGKDDVQDGCASDGESCQFDSDCCSGTCSLDNTCW